MPFKKKLYIVVLVLVVLCIALGFYLHRTFTVIVTVEQNKICVNHLHVADYSSVKKESAFKLDTVTTLLTQEYFSLKRLREWISFIGLQIDHKVIVKVDQDMPAIFLTRLTWSSALGGFSNISWEIRDKTLKIDDKFWRKFAESIEPDSAEANSYKKKEKRENVLSPRKPVDLMVYLSGQNIYLQTQSPLLPSADSTVLTLRSDETSALKKNVSDLREVIKSGDFSDANYIRLHTAHDVSAAALFDIMSVLESAKGDNVFREIRLEPSITFRIGDAIEFNGDIFSIKTSYEDNKVLFEKGSSTLALKESIVAWTSDFDKIDSIRPGDLQLVGHLEIADSAKFGKIFYGIQIAFRSYITEFQILHQRSSLPFSLKSPRSGPRLMISPPDSKSTRVNLLSDKIRLNQYWGSIFERLTSETLGEWTPDSAGYEFLSKALSSLSPRPSRIGVATNTNTEFSKIRPLLNVIYRNRFRFIFSNPVNGDQE